MRIGIDARMYGPRTGGGGLGRYVSEIVDRLQELDTKNEYVLFLKKENFHECVITNPRFYKVMADVHWYGLKEQLQMPRIIKQARVDFMHYPHWNIPIFSRVPFITTIHDLILLEQRFSARATTRNSLLYGFKYSAFRTVLESAIHRSRHIITVSEYSKSRILKHFGVRRQKITVIHNGVLPAHDARDVSLSELSVFEPYFLYVGNAYPHKNLEMMLHAFAAFVQDHPYVQLVIAGRRDVFSRELEKEAREIRIPTENLRFVDLPTDDELSTLYKRAALFIFPSRNEGFGMPPLEAMTYGTPVAAARSASLPEVLGDTAHFFDPDDVDALRSIMYAAVTRPTELKTKQAKGEALARSYTWEEAAKRTLDVYTQFHLLKK